MNLEKAIEIQENHNRFHPRVEYPDEWDASQLLIEAGKCLKQMRSLYTSGFSNPLPGETKE